MKVKKIIEINESERNERVRRIIAECKGNRANNYYECYDLRGKFPWQL